MSAWITEQTASVTSGSQVVTGQSTNWASTVLPGWAFIGPDNGFYEIKRVDSNTQITLQTPFLGLTASAQLYSIVPTQGLNITLAKEVQRLTAEVQQMTIVYRNAAAFYSSKSTMLAASLGYNVLTAGDVLWAGGIPYQVAPVGATDHDEVNASGVKLYSSFAGSENVGAPVKGPGFTGGSFDAVSGTVTFTSDEGLGFQTGDLRGPVGDSAYQTWLDQGNVGTEVDFFDDIANGFVSLAQAAADAASASETAAGTSETNAAASETAAGNSASAASASETAAGTSETNAAASETAAGTSETNAAASETAAGTSATNAAASEATTQTLRDEVLSRHIGSYVDDTSANASGFTITAGVFYWNTTTNGLRVYTGTTWTAAVLDAAGFLSAANNLSDLNHVPTAQVNLGLGSAATADTGDFVQPLGLVTEMNTQIGNTDWQTGVTNLGVAPNTTNVVITSDTGTDATIPLVGVNAGLMAPADKTKLTGIEVGADVTDTANVTAAGALMDSEVANLASIKAFNPADYATVAQGTKADNAMPKAGGTFTGNVTFDETTETVYNLTGTSIDPGNGTIQYKTLTANTTFTEALEDGQSVTLRLAAGATYTVTWPTMTWVGGSAPTLTANDVLVFWQEGTTVYGHYVGSVV